MAVELERAQRRAAEADKRAATLEEDNDQLRATCQEYRRRLGLSARVSDLRVQEVAEESGSIDAKNSSDEGCSDSD